MMNLLVVSNAEFEPAALKITGALILLPMKGCRQTQSNGRDLHGQRLGSQHTAIFHGSLRHPPQYQFRSGHSRKRLRYVILPIQGGAY